MLVKSQKVLNLPEEIGGERRLWLAYKASKRLQLMEFCY